VLCIGQCYTHIYEGVFDVNDLLTTGFSETFGTNFTLPETRNDIYQAWGSYKLQDNQQPMLNIMQADDYHPYTMGHIAGFYVKYYMKSDGWNDMGLFNWDSENEVVAPCTGSCRKYQDTVGYEPSPDPRQHEWLSNDTKYECTEYCRKWQPLQEGNDGGSLKRQEFVTPHIGERAHTYLRDSTITLADPMYDLHNESLQVIEQLRLTSSDAYKQDAVHYFDDKLGVRTLISLRLRAQFSETGIHSFQEELLSLIGISTAEYDGLVQAWHEKWHHDLVRPTTVIKHWGDDDLFTYSGDPSVVGPETIKARDFEAYIRVMPHPEFPSGSSCLCTTYYEFTDMFMQENYNATVTNIQWEREGRTYMLNDMEELRDVCGESRLWGGMHYTAAIAAGEQVCSGLGQLAYEYIQKFKNGATFDNAYYWGDFLGNCPPNPQP